MIDKNTILILGAGASKRYGYPLGTELKARILQAVNFPILGISKEFKYSQISLGTSMENADTWLAYLIENQRISPKIIKQFCDDFTISPKPSIDNFLENRQEFLGIGKVLIAKSIIECERHYGVFNKDIKETNWYEYLFNLLGGWDKFQNNKLSIITYNYDRSLEYFFIKSLMSTFGKSLDDAIEKMRHIPILHVHGKVDDYPLTRNANQYDYSVTPERIDKAVKNLHIIFEEKALQSTYDHVENLLSEAEQIFILGFGFHETNLKRLNLHKYEIPIYSSRTGIEDLELNRINQLTYNSIEFGASKDNHIEEFLRQEISIYGERSKRVEEFNTSIRYRGGNDYVVGYV